MKSSDDHALYEGVCHVSSVSLREEEECNDLEKKQGCSVLRRSEEGDGQLGDDVQGDQYDPTDQDEHLSKDPGQSCENQSCQSTDPPAEVLTRACLFRQASLDREPTHALRHRGVEVDEGLPAVHDEVSAECDGRNGEQVPEGMEAVPERHALLLICPPFYLPHFVLVVREDDQQEEDDRRSHEKEKLFRDEAGRRQAVRHLFLWRRCPVPEREWCDEPTQERDPVEEAPFLHIPSPAAAEVLEVLLDDLELVDEEPQGEESPFDEDVEHGVLVLPP